MSKLMLKVHGRTEQKPGILSILGLVAPVSVLGVVCKAQVLFRPFSTEVAKGKRKSSCWLVTSLLNRFLTSSSCCQLETCRLPSQTTSDFECFSNRSLYFFPPCTDLIDQRHVLDKCIVSMKLTRKHYVLIET